MDKKNNVGIKKENDIDYEDYISEDVEFKEDEKNKNEQPSNPYSMPLTKSDENIPNLQFFEENSYKVVKKGVKLKTKIFLCLFLFLIALVLVCILATYLSEQVDIHI